MKKYFVVIEQIQVRRKWTVEIRENGRFQSKRSKLKVNGQNRSEKSFIKNNTAYSKLDGLFKKILVSSAAGRKRTRLSADVWTRQSGHECDGISSSLNHVLFKQVYSRTISLIIIII